MEDTKLLTWLVVAALFVSLASGVLLYNKTVEVPTPVITDQDKEDIASLVLTNLPEPPAPVAPAPVVDSDGEPIVSEPLDNDKLDALYEDSDLDEEAEAEKLALEELNSRDFKKQLLDAINAETDGLDEHNDQFELKIDSWRDIGDVYAVDVEDVDVDDETGYVEIEFKVEYMLDDDEDEMAKARFTIVYTVEDLDDDDSFEDAEVEEEFDVIALKLYG